MSRSPMTLPRSRVAIMANVPQLPGEPEEAYLALVEWIAWKAVLKPSDLERRSGLHVDPEWRRRYDWEARLADSPYMRDGHLALDRVRGDELVDWLDGATKDDDGSTVAQAVAKRSLVLMLAELERGSALPTAAQVRDIAAVAKTLAEVERLKAGMSTAHVAVQATQVLDPSRLAQLTTEQLDALEAAMPQLLGGEGGGED